MNQSQCSAAFNNYCILSTLHSPVVDTLLILYQLGICAVYVVFIGSSLRSLIAPDGIDERWYYVALLVPFLLVLSIRNLKQLVPFSAFANVMMALGLGIVLYYVFSDMSHIGDRELAKSIVGLPQFFSICLFALEAIGVVSLMICLFVLWKCLISSIRCLVVRLCRWRLLWQRQSRSEA